MEVRYTAEYCAKNNVAVLCKTSEEYQMCAGHVPVDTPTKLILGAISEWYFERNYAFVVASRFIADNTTVFSSEKDFVWTDELVLDFVKEYRGYAEQENIDEYKQSKQRVPLLRSDDNVQLYEADIAHIVTRDYQYDTFPVNSQGKEKDFIKLFSTREDAENYIRLNKPSLSIRAIEDAFSAAALKGAHDHVWWIDLETELKQLVKI